MKNKYINEAIAESNKITENKAKRLFVIADMLRCHKMYHILPREYAMYHMNKMSDKTKKRFLVLYDQYVTYAKINSESVEEKFQGYSGKIKEYMQLGNEIILRDYLYLPNASLADLMGFVTKHKKVIFKPNHGSLGSGIYVYDESQGVDKLMELYQKTFGKAYICEEYLKQHEALNEFHTDSLNTVRVVSLNDHGNIKLLYSFIKFGCGDAVVDNLSHIGVGARVDINSGTVITESVRKSDKKRFIYHPDSNKQIKGFKIPNWNAVVDTVEKAARKIEKNPLLGWDIAVTENGAAIIEMNNRPGTSIMQIVDGEPVGDEVRKYCKKYKKELNCISKERLEKIKARFGI